ncbi:unnamed protein product [Prorocentrum cordatum]|uniref:Uncharacterized protein n=1 Tax=Prorocentrum cordatum TaxID=2364126 RepID=A0ABN9VM07_9DINO|nr:unnamed protein product [Polarella glacialis]
MLFGTCRLGLDIVRENFTPRELDTASGQLFAEIILQCSGVFSTSFFPRSSPVATAATMRASGPASASGTAARSAATRGAPGHREPPLAATGPTPAIRWLHAHSWKLFEVVAVKGGAPLRMRAAAAGAPAGAREHQD